jgi:probable addiction module antidote protein
MTTTLIDYDAATDLIDQDGIVAFMTEALETSDAAYIAHAVGVVARAKGMSSVSNKTGLSREQLYRSFSRQGNPTLKSTLLVMKALGLQLSAAEVA